MVYSVYKDDTDMADREQIIKRIEELPEELMDEISDFVEFVAARRADREFSSVVTRAQQDSMNDVWDNEEDEVWNDLPTG